MGSVKGETKSANFWQGKVYTHGQVRIFGKGKCKLIANFSATMVTSLPSLSVSLSLSLSLSLSPSAPHAQYRKRFRASYNDSTTHWDYLVTAFITYYQTSWHECRRLSELLAADVFQSSQNDPSNHHICQDSHL